MTDAPLPDGVFPRLNASLLRTGSWSDSLASFVGKFQEDRTTFRCCDGGTIQLSGDYYDFSSAPIDKPVEIMGQAIDATNISVFIVRDLSDDMDLALYNSMIEVQHSPKFAQFFQQ